MMLENDILRLNIKSITEMMWKMQGIALCQDSLSNLKLKFK